MHRFNTLLTIACNTWVGQYTARDIGHSLRKGITNIYTFILKKY